MTTGPVLVDPGDEVFIQFDWSDNLAGGVTLSSVDHIVQAPMEKLAESFNSDAGTSAVKVSGVAHGGRYMVSAEATLSTGEVVNRQWPVLGWNA